MVKTEDYVQVVGQLLRKNIQVERLQDKVSVLEGELEKGGLIMAPGGITKEEVMELINLANGGVG